MKALILALALFSTGAYAAEALPVLDAVFHPENPTAPSSSNENPKVIQANAGYCCAYGLGTDGKTGYSCGVKLTGCEN